MVLDILWAQLHTHTKKEKDFSLPLEFTAPAAVETNLGSDTGTTAGKLETSWDRDKQTQIIALDSQIILTKSTKEGYIF